MYAHRLESDKLALIVLNLFQDCCSMREQRTSQARRAGAYLFRPSPPQNRICAEPNAQTPEVS